MARKQQNLPISYEEQMAREVENIRSRISTHFGNRIKLNSDKTITTPDGATGEEIEVVVVDFTSYNSYYDAPYSPDTPTAPACFAIGNEPSKMVPSSNSPDRQAQICAECPNNEFGSRGAGKACRNSRVLAVMPVTMDDEDPTIWLLSVPPTSIRAWDVYVQQLASKKVTPIGVVTRIYQDRGVAAYQTVRFQAVRPLESGEFKTYMDQRESAEVFLTTEPDVSQYQPVAKPAARRAPARRGAR